MHLNHQNDTLPRSQQSFQRNFSIYLRTSGTKKQSDKWTILLNSLTEVENTDFNLVEDCGVAWDDVGKIS